MKNFKPGQKVAWSVAHLRMTRDEYQAYHYKYNLPQEGEIVTVVKPSVESEGSWLIREYLISAVGTPQALHEIALHPLKEFGDRLTDKLLADLVKKIYRLNPTTKQL